VTFVDDGRIFGENGDSAFFLQFVTVHDAGFRELTVSEHSTLLEKTIDQGGFPVINMSNDSNISDKFLIQHSCL
jgi:hypothetical protein